MKLRLRHKVTGLALGAALLPALALTVFIAVQEHRSSTRIHAALDSIVDKSLDDTVRELYGLCVTANELVQRQVNVSLNVARDIFRREGEVHYESETLVWEAKNQFSGEVREVRLPEMFLGETSLGQNFSESKPTPVVDEVRTLVGGTATIFQRMNDEGDMLRVATNVTLPDGSRAIGTYIPAINPDGTPNRVIETVVSRRETFRGSAFVVNDWFLSAYEPIFDEQQRVTGILYVGVRRDSVLSLRRALDRVEVGRQGYVWVMFGTDPKLSGNFAYTQERFPHEGNASSITFADGNRYYEEIRQEAIRMGAGRVSSREVDWRDPSDHRRVVTTDIHFTYFPEWDWVIGLTAYEDDYAAPREAVSSAFMQIFFGTLIGGFAVVILVGLVAVWLGGLISRPITFLTLVAEKVAHGDLGGAMNLARRGEGGEGGAKLAAAKDETGDLYRAIMGMVENLRRLIGEVKDSNAELLACAGEIGSTAKSQEGTVQDFGSSSNEIAAAVKEISTTAKELTDTMSNVSESARQTGEAAGESRGYLDEMRGGAEDLSQATRSISDKLSVITERAANISNIVTTIAKVADQTNLLSLNAAIEAEKAGTFGLGFAVVAREIRRLADQTAVATLDIEQMVREMQSSVNAGVMEMDKFHQSVRGSVEDIGRLSGQMERIIQQVQSLSPRFDAVTEGMEAQSTGASQISEAVSQLNSAARQTAASLQNFRNTTEKLDRSVRNLDAGVCRFRMEEADEADPTDDKSTPEEPAT